MSRVRVLLGLGVALAVAAGVVVGTRLSAGSQSSPAAAATAGVHRPAAVSTAFPANLGNPGLSGRVRPQGDGSPKPLPPGIDGCDRNYADAGRERSVCVPSVTPEGGPVDCAFLRRVGFPPLVVVGADGKLLGVGGPAARGEIVCAG